MKKLFFITITLAFGPVLSQKIVLTKNEAEQIGNKIWKNECNGTKSGLTTWRKNDCASVGIGHFLWFPDESNPPYTETFPDFITFAQKEGKQPPTFIASNHSCPWKTREEFLAAFNSMEMQQLRDFLYETIALQTEFIIRRFTAALPKILNSITQGERPHITHQFSRVAQSPNGWYALIDYINFKSEGTNPQEQYDGQGWGLLQVLQEMKGSDIGTIALKEFARAAQKVLENRVKKATDLNKSHEQEWLLGWNNRIKTYIKA